MTIQELAIKHDYYASGSNYTDNDAALEYNTWQDFYEEFGYADIDMNLVFRWDVYCKDEGAGYCMQIIIILQRKGVYMPITIYSVEDSDAPKIVAFLKPHFDKIVKNWKPIF